MGGSDKKRRHRSKEEDGRGGRSDNKLTEEEQRLYDKARAYVEMEHKSSRHSNSRRRERRRSDSSEDNDGHNKRNKGRKNRSSDKYNSSDDDDNDSDVSSRRDRKRHRSSSRRDRKKRHKRSSRDRDDHHEKHKKKKSRHRPHDDDEKKHSKHSSKRHKKGKRHDDSFRQKATKHSDTSKLVSLGEIISEPPQEPLDTDTNYFSHNSHLRLYLFRHYGIYFEDLTSEESHDAFKEFVSKYNDGKLETAYYEIKGKLPQEALDQCQRTQHKWNFKTNKVELQSLKIVRDGVKKQTEYDADNNDKGGMMQRTQATTTAVAAAPGPKSAIQNDEHTNKLSYDERRRADKRHRERIKVGNEEMYGTGKADYGRERMIEKRREQANKIHGAARDRESEAGTELDDKAIYGGEGGGDISYEAALAREKKFRERKEAAKQERNSELLKKEEDKQKKMLEMLGIAGLKPGEKIKIAPRQP